MRAVDHMAGRQTVLEESRELVDEERALDLRAYRRAGASDHDALVRLYATAYWRTRRLDEVAATSLTELLARRRTRSEVEAMVRAAFSAAQATDR